MFRAKQISNLAFPGAIRFASYFTLLTGINTYVSNEPSDQTETQATVRSEQKALPVAKVLPEPKPFSGFQMKPVTNAETHGWVYAAAISLDSGILPMFAWTLSSDIKPLCKMSISHNGNERTVFAFFQRTTCQTIVFQVPKDAPEDYEPELFFVPVETNLGDLIKWCFPGETDFHFTKASTTFGCKDLCLNIICPQKSDIEQFTGQKLAHIRFGSSYRFEITTPSLLNQVPCSDGTNIETKEAIKLACLSSFLVTLAAMILK